MNTIHFSAEAVTPAHGPADNRELDKMFRLKYSNVTPDKPHDCSYEVTREHARGEPHHTGTHTEGRKCASELQQRRWWQLYVRGSESSAHPALRFKTTFQKTRWQKPKFSSNVSRLCLWNVLCLRIWEMLLLCWSHADARSATLSVVAFSCTGVILLGFSWASALGDRFCSHETNHSLKMTGSCVEVNLPYTEDISHIKPEKMCQNVGSTLNVPRRRPCPWIVLTYDSFSAWPRTARWAVEISLPPPPVITKWKCSGATAVQPHEVREAHGALKPPTLCWLSTCQASNLLQHQHQNKNSVLGASRHGFHGPASPVGVRCGWPCALSLFTSSGENREKEKHQLHNSTKTQQHPEHQYLHPDAITGIGRGGVVIRHWGLRVVELGEMFVLHTLTLSWPPVLDWACWFRSNIWHSGRLMDSEWLPQIIK